MALQDFNNAAGLQVEDRSQGGGGCSTGPCKRRRLRGKQSPRHLSPLENTLAMTVSSYKLLSLAGQDLGDVCVDPAALGRHLVAAAREVLHHPRKNLQLISGSTVVSEHLPVGQQLAAGGGGTLTCILGEMSSLEIHRAQRAVLGRCPSDAYNWQAWDCVQDLRVERLRQDLSELPFPGGLRNLVLGSPLQDLEPGVPRDRNRAKVVFPRGLQSLTVECSQSLRQLSLPSTLESPSVSRSSLRSLAGGKLPSSLKHLTYHHTFDGIELPAGLQSLKFTDSFNESLTGVAFPSGLQSLTFGRDFNQSLVGAALPSGLQSLAFGRDFDQCLAGVCLPSGLQSLTFPLSSCFNQSLAGVVLPSGLQVLALGLCFNRSLAGVQLPSGLQSLTFSNRFNQSLAVPGFQLPSSLRSLTFGDSFNQSLVGVPLPSGLESLTFDYDFNQSLAGLCLPGSLQHLAFGARFNQSLAGTALPSSLQSLKFGCEFNKSLAGVELPSSLRSLVFRQGYEQSLAGVDLPSGLQELVCARRVRATATLPDGVRARSPRGY